MKETGECIFDPTFLELAGAKLDLTIAGTADAITMVESQAQEVDEATMLAAFTFAHGCIREICQAQRDFLEAYRSVHTIPVCTLTLASQDKELQEQVRHLVTKERITPLFHTGKSEFYDRLADLEEQVLGDLGYNQDEPNDAIDLGAVSEHVYSAVKEHMRESVLERRIRLDGRKPDEIRPLRSSVGILPRTHGSGLFERGVTQVLSVTTLGGPGDIQIVDDMFEENTKRYIHHYNFPPYSVGEVRALRGVGRREVGHGRLAEKALEPVLPALERFPYFIRVVSETLTCNGSSSMASVCGSTLSLMDAGVPITRPVAGVAMGMIFDENTRSYVILSDIQAQEDFLGDLDFKIA
jgi:polyribonucleotide nucleotidyltransferase